jgi:hypothetical protein
MKKYILLFINLFIIVNSFNYSVDDFDLVSKPINVNINSNKNEIIKIDFNLPNAFIYNLIHILI